MWNHKLNPQETIELTHARELPAWTMLKVRDPGVGWRALTAHEICVLNEIFDLIMYNTDEKTIAEYMAVARTLGLVADEDNGNEQ